MTLKGTCTMSGVVKHNTPLYVSGRKGTGSSYDGWVSRSLDGQ